MKIMDMKMLRSWNPCYDPIKYLPEDWQGNALDILKDEKIPFHDKLWVVLRDDLVSDKLMRLFAVWSYRQTLKFIEKPDPRSIEAANVAEKFANNEASHEQLDAAYSAAWSAHLAAQSAARAAEESAAWSAHSAAWAADESAESATWSVHAAAQSAARAAAHSAAQSAARAARVAQSAARAAAQYAQQSKLIEMIIAGKQTGDTK